jgi:4-carboxymuconolactone decarboxylase
VVNKFQILAAVGGALSLGLAGGYFAAPAGAQAPQNYWTMTEEESFPADVHPESRGRLPIVDRASLPADRVADYDEHISPETTSLAGIYGPGGLRLHGSHEGREGEAMSRRLKELIRLVVSRELDQAFEWEAHEPVGLREGLEPEIIDVIRYRRSLDGVPETEAAIIQLGREYFQTHKVSSETYARVLASLGERNLVDMCVLMGDYVETAILLTVNDVHVEYGSPYILPVP